MAAVGGALTIASTGYGYHRDELYFRMLRPAWGYVDQPPLTPLLARTFASIADETWAMRIPATLATVAAVYVVALITRELGGARFAQALCAWGFAFAALPLIGGHVMVTAALDLPVWPTVLLFIIRAQLRSQPRWWLAAGAVGGVSVYNKLLVAVLLAALAAGFALVGPRTVFRSRWVLGGAFLALVIGLPNLLYQGTHHWPQFAMGRALAQHNAGEVRVLVVPFLAATLGPPLVPIWIAGIVALLRRPNWREVQFLAVAFPVLVALVIMMGAQFYYPSGLLAVLFAAGCVPVEGWLARRRTALGRALVATGVAVNAAISSVLALPLIPLSALGASPVPAINQVAADSVGWPAYVAQIASAYAGLPLAERARAVIVASNYGEAGAVERYGARYRLPKVYSGQNQLYFEARPPDAATVVVFVGGQLHRARDLFASCREVTKLDNGIGVDNEEQDQPVAVCTAPLGGWAAVWPALKHLD